MGDKAELNIPKSAEERAKPQSPATLTGKVTRVDFRPEWMPVGASFKHARLVPAVPEGVAETVKASPSTVWCDSLELTDRGVRAVIRQKLNRTGSQINAQYFDSDGKLRVHWMDNELAGLYFAE